MPKSALLTDVWTLATMEDGELRRDLGNTDEGDTLAYIWVRDGEDAPKYLFAPVPSVAPQGAESFDAETLPRCGSCSYFLESFAQRGLFDEVQALAEARSLTDENAMSRFRPRPQQTFPWV